MLGFIFLVRAEPCECWKHNLGLWSANCHLQLKQEVPKPYEYMEEDISVSGRPQIVIANGIPLLCQLFSISCVWELKSLLKCHPLEDVGVLDHHLSNDNLKNHAVTSLGCYFGRLNYIAAQPRTPVVSDHVLVSEHFQWLYNSSIFCTDSTVASSVRTENFLALKILPHGNQNPSARGLLYCK